jgi:hypothetical protein
VNLAIIAAEDLRPIERSGGPFHDREEEGRCIEAAIERGRYLVDHERSRGPFFNVIVTAKGSVVALVRWNLDAMEPGSGQEGAPVEVFRFPPLVAI